MPATSYDVIIIGSGPGGGTLAYALRDCGARILIIERGDFLPQEPQNWSAEALYLEERYKTDDRWLDGQGHEFRPGNHYFVGGNTKFYGAALPRFRPVDFEASEHADGTSPAWAYSYEELAPYYAEAERLYRVHGADDDPDFAHGPYPYPPVAHEPGMARLAERIRGAGYTPSALPLGINLGPGMPCVRCATCDGFPCYVHAKSDAEIAVVRPALESSNVELAVGSYVRRILCDETGRRTVGVEVEHAGEVSTIHADTVVVSCGAVNSAALLLRSDHARHPNGLANSSGTVGRNYMVHNNSAMITINPAHRDPVVFQKTFYVNDFYAKGVPDHPFPLGQIQMIGKAQAPMLAAYGPHVPRALLQYAARQSVDWWLFSEDLPDPDNRVTLSSGGQIQLNWRPNNLKAHGILTREARLLARKVGFPFVFTRATGIEHNSHQAGTVRFGTDPATSALDPFCRTHEVENLLVVDSSFFPSLPAMNPVLTIAANALRVAAHLRSTLNR